MNTAWLDPSILDPDHMQEATETALAELFIRQNREQIDFLRAIETGAPSDVPEVKKLIAKMLAETYLEILKPIFARYPHIKPDNYP